VVRQILPGAELVQGMSSGSSDRNQVVDALIRLLDVEPAEEAGHFIGHRMPGGVGRVFGGQVVGQAIMAAGKTVPEDRPVHSLHCFFMRPGNEEYGIDYQVDADMDGRAFSNRRIVARQQGKAILNMIASFHRPEPGPAHQVAPPDVPRPEDLADIGYLIEAHGIQVSPVLKRMARASSPISFRPVGSLQSGVVDERPSMFQQCWMRVGDRALGGGQAAQRALLSYMSDMLLLATAYRPHGLHIGTPGIATASIDHSVWFHENVECGEWLLYATESPWTGHGRGFARGHYFSEDGRLLASVAQEGLIRLLEPET
jgi:acyl-CoA thioesterase-2